MGLPHNSLKHSMNQDVVTAVVDLGTSAQELAVVRDGVASPEQAEWLRVRLATLKNTLVRLETIEREHTPDLPAWASALQIHGQALFELLDGPANYITSLLKTAATNKNGVHLVVRLLGESATHAAIRWRFEALRDIDGDLADRPWIAVTVQLGDRLSGKPELLANGKLRILFMAYSPSDAIPVLDYEAEEEAIVSVLAEAIERGQATIDVVEEGTLAELERRMIDGRYDVVHLTGHGQQSVDGPVLLMEDELGDVDRVGTNRLLAVIKRSCTMPRLLVLASCETAEGRDDAPSMVAHMVACGVPAALGWVRPVGDRDATAAAKALYDQLGAGVTLSAAVAFARRQLWQADRCKERPTFAWATMRFVTQDASGFALDTGAKPPTVASPVEDAYQYLGDGQVRVLRDGFVGRRREIQRLLRLLRSNNDDLRAPVGAIITGMKGVGKSCLLGRVIDRHTREVGSIGMLVVSGLWSEPDVLQRMQVMVDEWKDSEAAVIMRAVDQAVEVRLGRLLRGPWRARAIVVVLDDFEENVRLQERAPARLHDRAKRLLRELLPACRASRAKVLITSTATFEMSPEWGRELEEVALGAFEHADVRKLWARGRSGDLKNVGWEQWEQIAARLGGNARVLDWARTLLGGRLHSEVDDLARRAGAGLPDWRSGVPSIEDQARLARLFLLDAAIDGSLAGSRADTITFLRRASVYEVAVPCVALQPLGKDLHINVAPELTALANRGLLELGRFDGEPAYRVNALVAAELGAGSDERRWHLHAAEFFLTRAGRPGGQSIARTRQAWEHAVRAGAAELAEAAGMVLWHYLHREGLYVISYKMARRQLRVFPDRFRSLVWAGDATANVGRSSDAVALLRRAKIAAQRPQEGSSEWVVLLLAFGSALLVSGNTAEAATQLECAQAILDSHPNANESAVAKVRHDLARLRCEQGDLRAARRLLEEALEIRVRLFGEESLEACSSLYELAAVMIVQGDVAGARVKLERCLLIETRVRGTDEHPHAGAVLDQLATVYSAAGQFEKAEAAMKRSLDIHKATIGGLEHHNLAVGLHNMGRLYRSMGDLRNARTHLENALAMASSLFGTESHRFVVTCLRSLAVVRMDLGEDEESRRLLERALAIAETLYGAQPHAEKAAVLHEMSRLQLVLRNFAEAQAAAEKSLEELRQLHGENDHLDVAMTKAALAEAKMAHGDMQGSEVLLREALLMQLRLRGSEMHPDVAAVLGSLAIPACARGDYAGAIQLLRRARSIDEKVNAGRETVGAAESEVVLGGLLVRHGEREEGERLISHARDVIARLAPHHPVVRGQGGRQELPPPSDVASMALAIRQGRKADPRFDAIVNHIMRAGGPQAIVVAYLAHIAAGGDPDFIVLPGGERRLEDAIADPFPGAIRSFLREVREAAVKIAGQN